MNRIHILVLCVSASALVSAALGQSPASSKPESARQTATEPAKAKPAPAPAAAAGMIISIDPVTRKIQQPTAEDVAALSGGFSSGATAAGPQGLRTISGPGNAVGLDLGNTAMSYSIVTKTPDGKLKTECVTGQKAAESRVNEGATAAKKEAADVQ